MLRFFCFFVFFFFWSDELSLLHKIVSYTCRIFNLFGHLVWMENGGCGCGCGCGRFPPRPTKTYLSKLKRFGNESLCEIEKTLLPLSPHYFKP